MLCRQALPYGVALRGKVAYVSNHELVLRLEVTIERHFIRLSCLGDQLNTDAVQTMAIEQLAGHGQNALPRRRQVRAACVRFSPGLDQCLALRLLTAMLPTGTDEVLPVSTAILM